MKVLVIGSGGREHTIVWKLKQSPQVSEIFCAPGNAGIAEIATCVDIKANDIEGLLAWVKDNTIDLTVVGPEEPLVLGIVDAFESEGLRIFGPYKDAAQLEGSKAYMKQFLKKYFIPTAGYETFLDKDTAWAYIQKKGIPIVIKTDGLAAGKGVFVCMSLNEVEKAFQTIFDEKAFGDAGNLVVVEEFMEGEETSILAFCDGDNALIMDASQDHKRAFDNDEGPNTGGMGAYCPAPVVTKELYAEIHNKIIIPTLDGMKCEGVPYKGILYAGLMLTNEGPKVVEYNVRFGDPETQVVLPRLKTDMIDVMQSCIDGSVLDHHLEWDERVAVCVVLASEGYPSSYKKGKAVTASDALKNDDDAIVFHAGTIMKDGQCVTAGGRVLGVTAYGDTIQEAIDKAYQSVNAVNFKGMFYRKDIGRRAMEVKKIFGESSP